MGRQLDFTIGLEDEFTDPLGRIYKQVEKLEKYTNSITKTFQKMGTGALAIWGVGKAFNALVEPAQSMQKALDLADIGGVKELDKMRKQAKLFTSEYATNAVDFVNSSVLIKNSIKGITDRALPKMTDNVNLLAKATGSGVEESTHYLAKMLEDYKQTAIKMGGMNFTKHVANIAAYAKQNFSMSPTQTQSMMTATKGIGTNYGVDITEQFAVLGMLNQSMGGSGTDTYNKMLQNMQSAGKQLGLTFTDTTGKLLAMPEILEKLQSKFGKNIDSNIKAQQALDKAFGSSSSALKVLLKNSDTLNKHLTILGQNNGLNLVQKMAEANVNPWDKINAKINNMQESIGRVLLPVFNPLFNMLDKTVGKVAKWLEMFPNLAKWIGIVVSAFMALAAVGAVLSIVSGALSLLLSPITLIVLGIGAIAAGAYFLWSNWDKVTSWMMEKWNAFLDLLDNIIIFKPFVFILRNIGTIFEEICSGIKLAWNTVIDLVTNTIAFKALMLVFDFLGNGFNAFIELITGNWQGFIDIITNNPILKLFMSIIDSVISIFNRIVSVIKNTFIDAINWIIEKINYIPGIDIDLIRKDEIKTDNDILTGGKIKSIDRGGIMQDIKNNSSQSIDYSKNINGSVTIVAENGLTPEQLYEWMTLQNG